MGCGFMEKLKMYFKQLLEREDLFQLPTEEALQRLGELIDMSMDLQRKDGIQHAMKQMELFQSRDLSPAEWATSHYFLANAWSNLRLLAETGHTAYTWEYEEVEKEIVHLRSALMKIEEPALPSLAKCQILTNLGNNLSYVGRFVEAIDYWNKALQINPSFGMALGNKGFGLCFYARALYDDGHARMLTRYSYVYLKLGVESKDTHQSAKKAFKKEMQWIESVFPKDVLEQKIIQAEYPLGDTEEEVRYRKWCLKHSLFLNPLNDLSDFSLAAQDIFNLPSITTGVDEGPYYFGFFNQMKQEYVSARYMYYEAIHADEPHFADKDVYLYNTMDYPIYSLASEKMKMAFRTMYSLFDKISYFMNDYWGLGIDESRVNFRTLWYHRRKKNNGLREEFQNRANWPLRGLFWLSKDLYENNPDFRDVIEPEARGISNLRNHIEHKYLKLHDQVPYSTVGEEHNRNDPFHDKLAYSISYDDVKEKTFKLMKLVRAAMIYLSLAVHQEEREKEKQRKNNDGLIMPMYLDRYDDEWKQSNFTYF